MCEQGTRDGAALAPLSKKLVSPVVPYWLLQLNVTNSATESSATLQDPWFRLGIDSQGPDNASV
jgi:hypothetical protein